MEYKLNKIDTEVRQRIEDTTKEGLIHRKKEIKINKDSNKNTKHESFSNQLKKHTEKNLKKGKRVSVEAEKVNELEVEAYVNEKEKSDLSSGRFLDIKR